MEENNEVQTETIEKEAIEETTETETETETETIQEAQSTT